METDRARPYPLYVEPLKSLPIVLISLFIVVAAVDALLALQPGLLHALRAYWAVPASGGTMSSALAAASLIVGGVAFSATTLAAFIRGVRTAPYLCITPVWVCACMLAIARVNTPLPLPVPTSLFVAISALLFVGSGVLFESTSRLSNLIGAAASLLPLTLLSIGYAFNPNAQASVGSDATLNLFLLALAAAGAPAVAVACRANGTRVLAGQSVAAPEWGGAQIVELLERARISEERAAEAERQLTTLGALQPQAAGANGPRLALDEEEVALTRPRAGSVWFGWAAAGVVLVVMIAWYAIGYAPLRSELASATRAGAKQAEAHAAAVAELRADFERRRGDLEQQLAAATQPVQAAAVQPATAAAALKPPRLVAVPREAAPDAADDSDSDARAEREARAQARRDARNAKLEQAAAERAEHASEQEATHAAAVEAREAARQARVAEHEQRAAERQAKAAERAEAKANQRDATAGERAATTSEGTEAKTGEKVERSKAAAATAALEAATYGADTGSRKSSKVSTEKAASAPAAPPKSAADVDDDLSDDPLQGL